MRFLLLFIVTIIAHIVVSQQDTTSQGLYNKIISLDETIRNDVSKQTSSFNPNDDATLPIGIVREIGNSKYIICIDSAWFTPDGAFFNVYMAMMPPNSDKPIAFAAKGIQFNPKGVSVAGGAKLQLVTQQVVNIGPKLQMVFKDDGQNFVEFDCNGYKMAGLSLDFIFDSESFENASDPSLPVKASMQMTATDLSDITYQLQSISPFRLKAAKDFVFSMSNIIVDLSDLSTPSGIPSQYINVASLPNGLPSWTGFYAQNISVKLPQKLESPNNPATTIYANNMIIDDSGLSGQFGATNVLTDGDMSGAWGFTIDDINVDIAHNSLVAGNMDGVITIPQLDDTDLDYNANIFQTQGDDKIAFNFTVAPSDTVQLSPFKSKLNISPCSQINIGTVGNQFLPSAVLTGDWTVDFQKAKFNGIAFQNLHLETTAPYMTSGTFALTSNGNGGAGLDLFGLGVSLNSVGLSVSPQGQLQFMAGLGMNLGSGQNTFQAQTNVRVITDLAPGADGRDRFTYNRMAVDDIALSAQTTAFSLSGVISVRNDDPVFGDLFFGSLSLDLNCLPGPMLVSAGFGKLNGNKYWFTEAAVPTNIPIGSGLSIKSIYGGVQKGVLTNQTDQQMLTKAAGILPPPPQNGVVIPFTPDQNQGLTFRAGVGMEGPREEAFHGEALLEVAFNANGGFQSIQFLGQAYMMVKRQDRFNANAKKVYGDISVLYDHANKVFDAGVNAQIVIPGKLTGNLNIILHIDTNDWYFWLNNPVNRANLNLVNMFYVNTYFMVGTQIMPIPPPPSYVSNLVGAGSIGTLDPTALGNGGGFATGMEFGVNFGGEFPKTTTWRGFIQVNVGGGFDVMLLNVQNAHCQGSSEPVGVNGYYAMGQVYVYLGGNFGVRKYRDNGDLKNEYNMGSLQVAALLQGKLPKPAYVYGAIGLQANVLGIINFSFNADVEFGTDCTLVGI